MKYLGPVVADEDVATKEYVDAGGSSGSVRALVVAMSNRTGAGTTGAAGWTNVPMTSVFADPESWYDGTYGGFRPPAGKYLVSFNVGAGGLAFQTAGIFLNGAIGYQVGHNAGTAFDEGGSAVIEVDGSQTISAGAYCTSNQSFNNADCRLAVTGPLEGAGGTLTPMPFPQVADFTQTNFHASTTAADLNAGFIINGAAAQSGFAYMYKAAPATPWALYAKVNPYFLMQQYPEVGIVLQNASSSKAITAGPAARQVGAANWGTSFIMERFTNLTTYSALISEWPLIELPEWYKVTNDGTTLTFYASFDGKNWIESATELLSAHIISIDRVGIGLQSTPSSAKGVCSYFAFEDPAQYLGVAVSTEGARGTAFPVAPTTGERFFRTDRGIEYFWDGARWLSTQLHMHPIATQDAIVPISAGTAIRSMNPGRMLGYDLYIEKVAWNSYNTATTAGNYFTAQLYSANGATNANIGASMSGAGDTQNAWVNHTQTINAVLATDVENLEMSFTETGAANTYTTVMLSFRLIG